MKISALVARELIDSLSREAYMNIHPAAEYYQAVDWAENQVSVMLDDECVAWVEHILTGTLRLGVRYSDYVDNYNGGYNILLVEYNICLVE